MKKMYEPQNANHKISHNTLTAAAEAVFRTMLDSVEGETGSMEMTIRC